MRGVPMAVIAQQLGHADTRMTERHYAHLAPNYVADTIRRNFPRLTASDQLVVPLANAPQEATCKERRELMADVQLELEPTVETFIQLAADENQ